MAFVLLIFGAALLVASVRNTQDTFFGLLKADFTGPNNFIFWLVSIMIIGAVGYIPKLKPISVGFMALVIMVLILTKGNPASASGGFFQKFTQAIGTTQTPAASPVTAGGPSIGAFGLGSGVPGALLPPLQF